MTARVATAQGQQEKIAETVQFFEDVGVPSCLGVAGFKAAYFFDRTNGKWVELSLWESKGAHEAALAAGAQRLEGHEEAQMIGAGIHAGKLDVHSRTDVALWAVVPENATTALQLG
jgi:hypothetical protein